jgi:DNA mismatch repair protein MLH1
MLKSYFSICFEKKESEVLVLKELPILLEGHTPSPQGLPSFLLRLANEVNMKDEYLCFEGVCSEIGVFYGDIPAELLGHQGDVIALTNDRLQKFARHTVFPGLKYLLTPPEKFSSDGSFCILTKLSALYKVFERC